MTYFEKALLERAGDETDTCYCAGPTCSGCEITSVKLFSMGARWARDWLEKEINKPDRRYDLHDKIIEIAKLNTENQRFRDALTFYASPDSWVEIYGQQDTIHEFDVDNGVGGKQARQALENEGE